jgi:nucleotide-binding universal stress UspA family protein
VPSAPFPGGHRNGSFEFDDCASYLIVVGVDGSEGGRRALDWAATEAASRGGAVQTVTAWSWDGIEHGPITGVNPADAQARASRMLEREVTSLIERRGSGMPVAGDVIEGRPADVLTAAALAAELLVLGSHGHSRVHHNVLGSVSEESVCKAPCLVVVIPLPVARARYPAETALRSRVHRCGALPIWDGPADPPGSDGHRRRARRSTDTIGIPEPAVPEARAVTTYSPCRPGVYPPLEGRQPFLAQSPRDQSRTSGMSSKCSTTYASCRASWDSHHAFSSVAPRGRRLALLIASITRW